MGMGYTGIRWDRLRMGYIWDIIGGNMQRWKWIAIEWEFQGNNGISMSMYWDRMI